MYFSRQFRSTNLKHIFLTEPRKLPEKQSFLASQRMTLKARQPQRKVHISRLPVVVILGPTGSGKTGVAIEIAKALNGEVISADSRAVYRDLDIGTAKPTLEEQAGVPHFGIDLVSPLERFTVADWKEYAEAKIKEIRSRGHLPIIAGGTGLYVDALIFDYHFKGPTGMKIGDVEQKSCSDRKEIKGDFLLIGIKTETEVLRKRLEQRVSKMFVQSLFDEVTNCLNKYGTPEVFKKSDIYEYAYAYMRGEMSLEEAKKRAFYEDWHLAKRQMTWFKRNPEIKWLPLEKVCPFVVKYIQDGKRN